MTESVDLAKAIGVDPLAVVLAVAGDDKQPVSTRLHAAAIALPFVKPKLSSSLVGHVDLGAASAAARPMPELAERFRRLEAQARISGDPMADRLGETAQRFEGAEPGSAQPSPVIDHLPPLPAAAHPAEASP